LEHTLRLEKVLDGDLCSGCGLCASIIGPDGAQMTMSAEGYLRPEITRLPTPAQADLIDAVCPGGRLDLVEGRRDPVWGPVAGLYTGWATDEETRHRGSSGGALSALLEHVLDTGTADYVLHVGADKERPWLNRLEVSTMAAEVVLRAGSRYAPSSPRADIVQRLDDDRRFVVVAKPCDIAGLRQYARHDPRVDERIPVMVSFMCGGIPSERGVLMLLERMGLSDEEVVSFRFRGHGWPGRATATTATDEERSLSYAETWGDVLSKHVQRRCKICPDGMGAFADVVCADAWHIAPDGRPSFDEAPGRSLVLTRTPKGIALVNAAVAGGALVIEPLELQALEAMQPHQARRTRLTRSRIAAMALLARKFPRYQGLHLGRAAAQAGIYANVKSLAGTLRRIVLRRL
jgi:coenzyme F420 hydrogenase subunit beta